MKVGRTQIRLAEIARIIDLMDWDVLIGHAFATAADAVVMSNRFWYERPQPQRRGSLRDLTGRQL